MKKIFLMMVVAMATMFASAQDHAKKNVVLLGDSNTALAEDDCSGERGWPKWFKDIYAPATCISYARFGATWTNNALTKRNTEEKISIVGNCNVIYNQVSRLKDTYKAGNQPEPSLIIIACGTYDAWFNRKRPEMYDMSASKAFKTDLQDLLMKKVHQVTSLAESVRYNCEILRDAFPDAEIVLVTPLQSVSAGEATIKKVSEIIADCGTRLGVNVIRLDKDGCVKFADERLKKHYTKEGNLTSVEGAKNTGELIAERLK